MPNWIYAIYICICLYIMIYNVKKQLRKRRTQYWHDDVTAWKSFQHCWPIMGGIHFTLINSSLLAWMSYWTNSRVPGDLRCHDAHMTSLINEIPLVNESRRLTNDVPPMEWNRNCPFSLIFAECALICFNKMSVQIAHSVSHLMIHVDRDIILLSGRHATANIMHCY